MANDRLYIKCTCGEALMLAKFSGEGAYWTTDGIEARLDDFLTKHNQECLGRYANLGADAGFALRTEASLGEPHPTSGAVAPGGAP